MPVSADTHKTSLKSDNYCQPLAVFTVCEAKEKKFSFAPGFWRIESCTATRARSRPAC